MYEPTCLIEPVVGSILITMQSNPKKLIERELLKELASHVTCAFFFLDHLNKDFGCSGFNSDSVTVSSTLLSNICIFFVRVTSTCIDSFKFR